MPARPQSARAFGYFGQCRRYFAYGATDALSAEEWQQTFAVNVGGAFNLFQQTMAQFRRQQGGAIVTVASDAAHTPRIGMSAYGASKPR